MNSETSPRRRAPAAAGWILLGLLGLLDVFANGVPDHRWTSLLPMVSGPLVCLALLRPAHRPSVRVRGALVAGGSLVCTIVIALWASPNLNGTFGG
ncbi:two-component sensor histidine kinase, partial [Streptomyces scabiei]|nr:two-component sensor histidine kinase [Streptomyces scabiei]